MHRGFRFKLCPTVDQAEVLGQWVGVTRLIYNLALEQRRDFWRQYRAVEGREISLASQGRELTALRAEFDWIAAVPQTVQEAALNDLDKAFAAFFRRAASYPQPRRLGEHDTARFRGRNVEVRTLNAKWSAAKLPKIGWVKFRQTRALPAGMKTATISRRGGQWALSFLCDAGVALPANSLPAVGVDRGVANTLSLSTGEHIRLPDVSKLETGRRKAQRVLARRKRGSRRYGKQRQKITRLHSRVSRIRTHHLHLASTALASRFGVVALEALDVGAMTKKARGTGVRQKAGLNRSIRAQGWTLFASLLDYKLEAAGGRLIYVPAAYTSQTCSACGVVDAQSRKNQAVFACVHCGHRAHADTNAALEIRRRSTALLLAEGGHLGRPAEPRTLAA